MASFSNYIAFLLALRLRTRKSRLPTAKHQRGVLVCMCVPFVHGHSGLKLAHFGVPVSKFFIWTFNLKSLKARSGYVLISSPAGGLVARVWGGLLQLAHLLDG